MAGSNRSIWVERSIVLARLGYPDYETYLGSARWERIRGEVLARDGRRCVCGDEADQVHHRRYDEAALLGETLDWMVSVCASCHRFISRDRNGNILTPEQSEGRLSRVLPKAQRPVRSRPATPQAPHCPTCRCFARGPKKPKRPKWAAAKFRGPSREERSRNTASVRPDGSWDVSGGSSTRRT